MHIVSTSNYTRTLNCESLQLAAKALCLTFDELTKHTQSPSAQRPAWTGSTSVGNELKPDIERTVSDLVNSGYNSFVDAEKLIPLNFPAGTPRPAFPLLYSTLANKIVAWKQAATDKFPGDMFDAIQKLYSAVQECRVSDIAGYRLADIRQRYGRLVRMLIDLSIAH